MNLSSLLSNNLLGLALVCAVLVIGYSNPWALLSGAMTLAVLAGPSICRALDIDYADVLMLGLAGLFLVPALHMTGVGIFGSAGLIAGF